MKYDVHVFHNFNDNVQKNNREKLSEKKRKKKKQLPDRKYHLPLDSSVNLSLISESYHPICK